MEGTMRCSANYVPLTPISFLERSAVVYRDRIAVVYGDRVRFTWRETHERCVKVASSLASHFGICRGDVVAVLAPNVPEMYELHFAVPMAGAVLCTLNIRHDPPMLSTLLLHSAAKLLFVDHQYLDIAKAALEIMSKSAASTTVPRLVVIPDSDEGPSAAPLSETVEYRALLETGRLDFEIRRPNDECDAIALNYTSGTTSSPKGVVYSHRGTYLNSLSAVLLNEMPSMAVYLWTVPMFHCNGWCMAWAVAAQGGTNVCLQAVTAKGIFECLSRHCVTHMGGAPTVLNMIVHAADADRSPLPGAVVVMTGAAPPPASVLFRMEQLGFNVHHSYGLTETYGPATICTWKPEWTSLSLDERAAMKSRQGLNHVGMEAVDVKDPITMESVPPDGRTIGEVMFRGNTVMNGYLNDGDATAEAFSGGWFRSGDLGVRHPDGYVELKDRSKDIVISGGENISTIEVESVLFGHPGVVEAAVVGRPDDYWGETPIAFVRLKEGFEGSGDDIIDYCRRRLPRYMAPRTVVFVAELPKTSTGKTRKFVLRQKAKAMGSLPPPPPGGRSKL